MMMSLFYKQNTLSTSKQKTAVNIEYAFSHSTTHKALPSHVKTQFLITHFRNRFINVAFCVIVNCFICAGRVVASAVSDSLGARAARLPCQRSSRWKLWKLVENGTMNL